MDFHVPIVKTKRRETGEKGKSRHPRKFKVTVVAAYGVPNPLEIIEPEGGVSKGERRTQVHGILGQVLGNSYS